MYTITLHEVYEQLKAHHLLVEFPEKNNDLTFTHLSYDSRETHAQTLFFCKGAAFKKEYLETSLKNGLTHYLSEIDYHVNAQGIIVTDIRLAMAVLAQHFYQHPEKKLTKIAITGTKGKTTTSYFIYHLLKKHLGDKVALFSSEQTTVDGKTYLPSSLSTPEALVLYAQMAQAVENNLTHLVMEVSSQAYKTKRVAYLTFEIGVFLNISPDHISPIEHPTFEDYFACKKELIANSQQMILSQYTEHFDEILATCHAEKIPTLTYGEEKADFIVRTLDDRNFSIQSNQATLAINGEYSLEIYGTFNQQNATAALIVGALLGVSQNEMHEVLPTISIPGRLNLLKKANGALVFVDFAHNYLSLHALGVLAGELRPQGRKIFMTGSAGGKALSRRPDIGKALSEQADLAILTSDDPNFESPDAIADQIQAAIQNPSVQVYREMDRKKAIELAISLAEPQDVVLLAGKGMEASMKIRGKDAAYESDWVIAKEIISKN